MSVDFENEWGGLSRDEKNKKLFLKQKELLDTFLLHNAISREQYNKSLNDLKEKMKIK